MSIWANMFTWELWLLSKCYISRSAIVKTISCEKRGSLPTCNTLILCAYSILGSRVHTISGDGLRHKWHLAPVLSQRIAPATSHDYLLCQAGHAGFAARARAQSGS